LWNSSRGGDWFYRGATNSCPRCTPKGYSRATFELEKQDDAVKLTVTHEINKQGSKFIQGVSGGWPSILSSLKSLLETGESLAATRHWPKGL
jgi:hypothetical protein